jgi:Nickel responsive protein SCO4226-like
MTEFLVELYVSKTDCAAVKAGSERLTRAAAELTAEGRPVRLVRSIFVPEDETCYLLLEAATAESVHETARRAALPLERVVETTLDLTPDERSNLP